MDYAKSITFVFDDPRWITKITIGTGLVLVSMLLSVILVGILGFFILAGYSIRLLQNVRDGAQYPLPEWDDWGGDFIRGAKYAVVGIVWALAMVIFAVPAVIGGMLSDGGSGFAEFMGGTILFCATCLMFLYGLFVVVAAPGFTISFASDERISSGLQFTEIWHWTRDNIGQVIIAVLVVLLAQTVISLAGSLVGALLCVVGLIITVPLATLAVSLFQHHVYGQLAFEFPFGGGLAGPIVPVDPDTLTPATTGSPDVPDVVEPESQDDGSVSEDDSGSTT